MKRRFGIFLIVCVMTLTGCLNKSAPVKTTQNETETTLPTQTIQEVTETMGSTEINENLSLKIQIGDTIMYADFADNSSVWALKEKLKSGSVTIEMEDYAGFEKVGPLGFSLPRNDESITTEAGDIILYQGNMLTIYYDTNSWNFTKIAKIRDLNKKELKKILGRGDVTVILGVQ